MYNYEAANKEIYRASLLDACPKMATAWVRCFVSVAPRGDVLMRRSIRRYTVVSHGITTKKISRVSPGIIQTGEENQEATYYSRRKLACSSFQRAEYTSMRRMAG